MLGPFTRVRLDCVPSFIAERDSTESESNSNPPLCPCIVAADHFDFFLLDLTQLGIPFLFIRLRIEM